MSFPYKFGFLICEGLDEYKSHEHEVIKHLRKLGYPAEQVIWNQFTGNWSLY